MTEESMSQQVTLSIVGSGGDGAVAAGDIIAGGCAAQGLYAIKTEAYGPQIRGGESSCTVRLSTTPIFAQGDTIDALVIFSWSDYARFASELVPADDCVIFYDSTDEAPAGIRGQLVAIPFGEKASHAKNILAIGLLAELFKLPVASIRAAMLARFKKKSAAAVEANVRAFEDGINLCKELAPPPRTLDPHAAAPRLLMSGNEATAFGAIHAGCSFFAGYPITPSTEVLQFLAEWLPKLGGTCIQTEDELSAIGAVIGASFAGAKAMTATSGPGLSLMAEMLGLSSIAEIPVVIANVQRGGPSTGIPTKSEQSDLMHALYASHGDTPRVVLACTDVEDSFHTTVDAFNIAEEFQVPVIVLSDQSIAQRRETIEAPALEHEVVSRRLAAPAAKGEYRRYADTDDGVSPMTLPGMVNGIYQTNGLEHDETGRPSSMYVVHERMNAKRYRKLAAIGKKYPLFRRFGADRPDLGIICWGSSQGPIREALDLLNIGDLKVAAFVPRILMPFPAAELQAFIDASKEILVIELSASAQFHQYLRTQVDLPKFKTKVLARSGGKALAVAEVIEATKRQLGVTAAAEVMA
jgi:2-oxoglutarate ferredoxin oxidoreductase subunit alpha